MGDEEHSIRNTRRLWQDPLGLTEDLRLSRAMTSALAEHSRWIKQIEPDQSLLRAFAEQDKIAKQYAFAMTDYSASISSVLANLRDRDLIPRSAIGPLGDLKDLGLFQVRENLLNDLGINRHILQNFEAGFRLPKSIEIARLAADVHTSAAAKAFESLTGTIGIQHAMESMKSPWLDIANPLVSASAFAAIQEMGSAINVIPTFDRDLTDALRLELGDWREQIEWPASIFTDLEARSHFYVSLGVNPALTLMPAPAFRESLEIAGFADAPLPVISESETEISEARDEDEERGFVRTNAAHDRLQRLEHQLRKFINEVMSEAIGPDWPKHRVPADTVTAWREKKQQAQLYTDADLPLIAYADFTDYERVICKRDNWKLFEKYFDRMESARESLQRLYPIRVDTMHARMITQDDELFLAVEEKRLLRAMRRRSQ